MHSIRQPVFYRFFWNIPSCSTPFIILFTFSDNLDGTLLVSKISCLGLLQKRSNSLWNFSSIHAEESCHPKLLPTLSLNDGCPILPIKISSYVTFLVNILLFSERYTLCHFADIIFNPQIESISK